MARASGDSVSTLAAAHRIAACVAKAAIVQRGFAAVVAAVGAVGAQITRIEFGSRAAVVAFSIAAVGAYVRVATRWRRR